MTTATESAPRPTEQPTCTIQAADWPGLLGCAQEELPAACRQAIREGAFEYRLLLGSERESVLLRVLQALDSPLEVSGPARRQRWEEGWAENLKAFRASGRIEDLIPRFIKHDVKRLNGQYVEPRHPGFEVDLVRVLWQFLFRTYFAGSPSIHEFGCGPGQNLVELSRIFPDKRLCGLDWAESSLEIVRSLRSELGIDVSARRFDFFEPDARVRLEPGAAVLTAGALEQTGTRFAPFLDWLLEQPFSVCVNVETLHELYDRNDLFDDLARRYVERRGYLRGYLGALRQLERRGSIRILKVHRVFGSLFHDVYTYVAWEKVPHFGKGRD